jgi:hypothetical protein
LLQPQYVKPSGQIRTFDAPDVFELLNSSDQEPLLDHLAEIRKQNGLEESEEPEPEPKERTVTVLKLTEELWPLKLT